MSSKFVLSAADDMFFDTTSTADYLEMLILVSFLKGKVQEARVAIENYFEGIIPRYTDFGKAVLTFEIIFI